MAAGPDPVPDPVGAAEFAGLIGPLGPFEPTPHLAVSVSGGRESLALGLLAQQWTAARGGRVTGLIVDHGLRSASAGEAVRTQGLLGRSGIAAAILSAPGRPRKNLQAWARAARYALMPDWCRDAGVLHLLVAHHRDDQAETVLANLTRNTSLRGMAGMAAVRELPACRILRPGGRAPAGPRACGRGWPAAAKGRSWRRGRLQRAGRGSASTAGLPICWQHRFPSTARGPVSTERCCEGPSRRSPLPPLAR